MFESSKTEGKTVPNSRETVEDAAKKLFGILNKNPKDISLADVLFGISSGIDTYKFVKEKGRGAISTVLETGKDVLQNPGSAPDILTGGEARIQKKIAEYQREKAEGKLKIKAQTMQHALDLQEEEQRAAVSKSSLTEMDEAIRDLTSQELDVNDNDSSLKERIQDTGRQRRNNGSQKARSFIEAIIRGL